MKFVKINQSRSWVLLLAVAELYSLCIEDLWRSKWNMRINSKVNILGWIWHIIFSIYFLVYVHSLCHTQNYERTIDIEEREEKASSWNKGEMKDVKWAPPYMLPWDHWNTIFPAAEDWLAYGEEEKRWFFPSHTLSCIRRACVPFCLVFLVLSNLRHIEISERVRASRHARAELNSEVWE